VNGGGKRKTERLKKSRIQASPLGHNITENRAGDGARTRDLLLGKEVFYQLNYTRQKQRYYTIALEACKSQKGWENEAVLGPSKAI
jgi:hypothetical protein